MKEKKQNGVLAENLGKPISLSDANLHGVSARAAKGGEKVSVYSMLAITSDDRSFHLIVENLVSAIEGMAQRQGKTVAVRRTDTMLMIIRPDDSAELWLDTAAMATMAMVKRPMDAGSVVFESDVADVTGMHFPLVEIGQGDRVICLFRQNWRFGLFFDFNPDGEFDHDRMSRTLGTLYRTMRYRHLYDALADESLFERLVAAGWFPFVEIIEEFRDLASHAEAGFDLDDIEQKLTSIFDEKRLNRMFDRWMTRPHFKDREPLLRAAIKNYLEGEPAATIKIVLTEIEGVLNDSYRSQFGKGAKTKRLLEYACDNAAQRAGSGDTLLFSNAFARYLSDYTFANFDPAGPKGSAGSRHAVGHGAADPSSYTMTRALQALLTIDQFGFYT